MIARDDVRTRVVALLRELEGRAERAWARDDAQRARSKAASKVPASLLRVQEMERWVSAEPQCGMDERDQGEPVGTVRGHRGERPGRTTVTRLEHAR
jgi:hypothetical protein